MSSPQRPLIVKCHIATSMHFCHSTTSPFLPLFPLERVRKVLGRFSKNLRGYLTLKDAVNMLTIDLRIAKSE